MLEEIEKFITKLLERPKDLTSSDSIKTLKKLSKQRVTNDRQVLKEKTDDIMKLTSLMSRYFDKTLTDGVNSNEEIIKIKDELVALDISKFSHRELRIVQKKLIDTIFKIETALSENKKIANFVFVINAVLMIFPGSLVLVAKNTFWINGLLYAGIIVASIFISFTLSSSESIDKYYKNLENNY